MTSILEDWGKKCLEKLIKRAIDEARFLLCFTCIAKEFEEERAKLQPESETLEQRVKEAKGRNKDITANVVSWKEEVDKLIQEDTKTKKTCFFGLCPDCIWRYKRGKKLANDTEKIKGLIEKADKFGNIEVSHPPPGVERNSLQDYISFESRLSKYNELLDALKDVNNYITGLQGMGGTGKTTLAIKVGKELKESGQFTYAIITTVSSTPDIKKIQNDIAGPLDLKFDGCTESDRPGKLWDRLTNGDKILLILDDVWDQNPLLAFDAIGIPKRNDHKGCRVLVTTRSKIMNFDKSIELELLSEDEAWNMFQWYADISKSSPKYVIDKGCEIAKECKQLPIAIAGIASSLKGQQNRVDEWDVTLKSLQKPVSMQDVDPDKVGIFNCLKVSYDNLKNEKAKKLFLLCSVFQEDKEVFIEDLTRISIGAGLFGEDYDTYDEGRKEVAVVKNKLLDSCLLLEVREHFVKMHDLIRDVAQWIAGKEIQGVNLSNKNQKSLIEKETNIKCLLFEGSYKDLYFCKFDASKLETLIVIENRDEDYNVLNCMEIPNSFFENIVKLRVLYLSCYGNRSLSLANSFQSLMNIRCMMVRKVDLGDISVLGKLQSLEALDLVKCKIHELPIEIEKLENLKLLRLESCKIGKGNPFEAIKICLSLEELYFTESFNDFCQKITLPAKLRRYLIGARTWRNELSQSKCAVLDEKVYGYFTKGTLEYFMQTADALLLNKVNTDSGWRNLMPEMVPIENGMNDLVELHLNYDSNLQCLIDTKQSDFQVPNVVFSKLVVLGLDRMERLEELCNGSISLDCLNNLKEVTISCCNHLKSLFKCSLYLGNLKKLLIAECSTLISIFDLTTSQSLLKLETLKIDFCHQLESIFTYERVDGDNDNSKSCNSMFPNLKVLSILGCPQLEFVLPLQSAQDLLLLESISITYCRKLKYIFGQHQDVQLASLKELKLEDLPNFIDIFPEPYDSMPLSIEGSSNSNSKVQTQMEPIKSNVFSWSHICCRRYKLKGPTNTEISLVSDGQPKDLSISLERGQCLLRPSHIMCNIKEIILVNLSKIKSVFVLFTSRMMLESLTIENCDELKHIVVDIGDSSGSDNSVFRKLKELEVKNCGKLEYIFGHIDDSNDHQNHNLHLPALKCLKLSSLPSLTGVCTKNYRTTFPYFAELELGDCTQVDIKSIGDFIVKMTSILEDWGKQLLEKLIKKAVEEARFLFCFTCIAKEFEEERARLEPEREALGQRVKVAKRKKKDIPANVVSWEEEVDKLIQEDTKTKKTCFFGFCPDCIWRYKKGKKMANNMEDIKQLIEKVDKFVNVELPRPPPGVERNSSQDYISLKGRESTYIELLKALKDDNNFITGLQGMGGTGKTTLAKEVGKKLKESGQFTYVIDTAVSFTPDIKKIQDDIAGPLGLKWEGCTESERPGKLWDRLTNGEKILLILDDVWDQDPLLDFGAIGIPKPDSHKGCRVLVTTRSKQLSKKMNFDRSIELELLSEEDVWIMFKRYANINESSSKDVKNKGREIAKECKQLPVAIAAIAGSLKGHQHRVKKWDATLTSLKKHVSLPGVDDAYLARIYACLKVSYDNMNDKIAKELFRLCSLFQEDAKIHIEYLTKICIGTGLVKDYEFYDDARNQVVVAIYDLVDSCLLLEVDEKHVKMHDLVRDMAQHIASKEIRVVNLSKKKSLVEWDVNIRFLSFEGKKIDLFSCKFDGSKLKTLIVNIERDEDCKCDGPCCACLEVPNSFFENTAGLQVLHFSSNVLRQISLPKSFRLLANIRSLLVNSVDLGDISVLGNLQSLEALDLVKCTIHELPIEIEKLENLKLLRLESCEIRKDNPFEVVKKCSSLEELYFIESFNYSCQEITLPAKLRRYHIGIKHIGIEKWKKIYLSVSKCVVLDEKVYGYFTKSRGSSILCKQQRLFS